MTFINYRASAGSGKTYQLVLEYLSLALQYDDKFRHILAITFTNKAAAEMKERILRSLKELSMGRNDGLMEQLKKRNDRLGNIGQRAGRVLKKILHNYSNFAVMTIDSFINRLVRSFTYETEIPAGFDVELNLSRMNRFIMKNIFSEIGIDPGTTDIIVQFALDRISRGRSWNVESNISPILSEINRERKEGELEIIAGLEPADFIRISDLLKKIFMEYTGKMKELGGRGMSLIQENGFSIGDFPYAHSGPAGYLNRLSGISLFGVVSTRPTSRFSEGKWEAGNSSKALSEKLQGDLGTGLNALRTEILQLYEEKFRTALSAFLIFENIYLLGLIGRIGEFLKEYKSEYNVVPIYDLTHNVHRLIREGDIPFIYYMLGDSFEHIMIDEFQDTSRMQWDSLFPLIENSVSEKKVNLGVGDLKQSIYRWRGGETDIMDKDIHEQFLPWNGVDSRNLPHNYRSREHIVEFNNRLFQSVREYGELNGFISRIYADAVQTCRQAAGGFVSLRVLTGEDPEPTVPELVERIVRDCFDAGFSQSDIAVLTRKKAPGMEIATHLIRQGFNIVSPEFLLLYKNPLAIFLIDLFKFTADNTQDHILSEILFFISKYFSGSRWNEKQTEHYFMDKTKAALPEPVQRFIEARNLLIRLPLYEAAEELIRIFDLVNVLENTSAGFIVSFLEMIKDYSEKEGETLSGFIEWWAEYGTEYSVPTPENGDGVTLMTIHKAKGLEFPVVIIPYSDWREKNEKNLWMKPEDPGIDLGDYHPPYFIRGKADLEHSLFAGDWEEEKFRSELDDLNLLYVACTRAKEALFIFTGKAKKKEEDLSNGMLLRKMSGSGFFERSGENVFEQGVLEKSLAPPEKIPIDPIEDRDLISTRWSGKITIRQRSEKFWDIRADEHLKKIDRGIIIHEILSKITGSQSAEQIIERMVFSGRIRESDSAEITTLIKEIFGIDEVRGWFSGDGEFLSEQPIITGEGTYRPDRVIIRKGSVVIVDFKTGKESDQDLVQMKTYRSLIRSMGYPEVRGILFYLSTGELKEV